MSDIESKWKSKRWKKRRRRRKFKKLLDLSWDRVTQDDDQDQKMLDEEELAKPERVKLGRHKYSINYALFIDKPSFLRH